MKVTKEIAIILALLLAGLVDGILNAVSPAHVNFSLGFLFYQYYVIGGLILGAIVGILGYLLIPKKKHTMLYLGVLAFFAPIVYNIVVLTSAGEPLNLLMNPLFYLDSVVWVVTAIIIFYLIPKKKGK